ncbi:MAG: hypothetical protein L3J39_01860 [Verrucomicrobiales bacterium]|nr:hypothetical protein [Verrucomicrobiales bacterium]
MKDTAPEINEMIFRKMMQRSEGERLVMGMDMQATARALIWASISKELSEKERREEFYQRFFGETCPW